MDYKDLPKDMQEAYNGLKDTFLSIQCEVEDALDESKTLEQFRERVAERMNEIEVAAKDTATAFKK